MNFEIIGEICNVEIIAVSNSIRDLQQLQEKYGFGRWRKLKRVAILRLVNGNIRKAEVHWYKAHGIGKRKIKIKKFLD